MKFRAGEYDHSYGMNNVVVTEFAASGFTAVGRQPLVSQ